MTPDALVVVFALVLGALIGSFSNVLIHRLPRRESIAFPPSNCPSCHHRLSPLDLFPVLSWLALRARCRYCAKPISARYPLVELLTAAGYALLALLFPWSVVGVSLLGLWALLSLLLVIAFIDADTRTIPDALVIPGIALGLLVSVVNERTGAVAAGLPGFQAALTGALLGTGVVAFIAMYGELVLRRLRERRHPEFPVSYQQVALAAFAGAWLGGRDSSDPNTLLQHAAWGVAIGVASVALNVLVKRVIRLPETLLLLGLLASFFWSVSAPGGTAPSIITMALGALAAAGGMSLLAALYWWTQPDEDEELSEDELDPVAMGFGDVKLAGMMGAFIGLTGVLVSLGVAILAGAVLGVVTLLLRRDNKVPFGPYLAAGAVVAIVYGEQVLHTMKGLYGLN